MNVAKELPINFNAASRFNFFSDMGAPTSANYQPRNHSLPAVAESQFPPAFNPVGTPYARSGPQSDVLSSAASSTASLWSAPAATFNSASVGSFGQKTAAQWTGYSDESSPTSSSPTTSNASLVELNRQLEKKESLVSELKNQVEVLVTAITLGQTGELSSMDGPELAHRMLVRLKSLREENERLTKLASHQHAARLELEVDSLKQENAALRRQLQ